MDKESRMKIISYNINKSTIAKIKYLLEQDADVYVIPEISEDIRNTLPSEYEMEYLGDIPSKGLGVIWRKGMCKLPQWYKDDYKQLSYAIPLIYDDVLILGIWPTNYKRKKTYTTLAKEIIEKYIPHFSEFKQCIITGDFNLYHKKDFPNKAANIIEIDSLLHDNNFKSIYHDLRGEAFGYETKKTFYMKFEEDNPFFLDYTYSKLPVKNYDFIKSPIEKFSDHIGQIIEI